MIAEKRGSVNATGYALARGVPGRETARRWLHPQCREKILPRELSAAGHFIAWLRPASNRATTTAGLRQWSLCHECDRVKSLKET
jgi:hypothetical protein